MSAPALEVTNLCVRYGTRIAVAALDLSVAPGEIVGVLGPNGAGKSTTLLAIAGALTPSSGQVRVCGHAVGDAVLVTRAATGFADQPPSLYEFLSLREHVAFVAETRGRADADVDALLDRLGLAAVAARPCRELSFGMRQRAGLAAALVGGVRVLLLDETLNGLDPHATARAVDVITAAAASGTAVLLSTHMLELAARLCGRVVVMDAGAVVARAARGEPDYTGEGLDRLYRAAVADRGAA